MGGNVVVAPDKFKGSLTAAEVAGRVAAGLARGGFAGEIVSQPVADGGDGTVAAAVSAGFRRVELAVPGRPGLRSRRRTRCAMTWRSSRPRKPAG